MLVFSRRDKKKRGFMMNQPPDHDFYNSSTEDAPFRPPQRPGYPQQPQSVPNPYATEQGPVSQPDSGSPDFPPAGPGPQNWRPGPQQQQDFPQQQQGFPPFQGPGPQGPGPGKSGSAWGAPPQPLPEPDGSS